MMDFLQIEQLKVTATIGVLPWEQRLKQTLVMDIGFPIDCQRAAQSDDLAATIDYTGIAAFIQAYLDKHPFKLLETLAENLCHALLTQFAMPQIQLKIQKITAIAHASHVAIRLERTKNA